MRSDSAIFSNRVAAEISNWRVSSTSSNRGKKQRQQFVQQKNQKKQIAS